MLETDEIAAYWNTASATFDAEPDHGLRRPVVRAVWSACLRNWIPGVGADVLDVGCGTGSLSALLVEQGHRVVGMDVAPAMVAAARHKIGGPAGDRMIVADAGAPPVGDGRVDVVLARHLLWTLPNPLAALRRWIRLLRPGGHLVLIEGRWDLANPGEGPGTPWEFGVPAVVLADTVAPFVARVHTELLTDPALWGRVVDDERYVLLAHI